MADQQAQAQEACLDGKFEVSSGGDVPGCSAAAGGESGTDGDVGVSSSSSSSSDGGSTSSRKRKKPGRTHGRQRMRSQRKLGNHPTKRQKPGATPPQRPAHRHGPAPTGEAAAPPADPAPPIPPAPGDAAPSAALAPPAQPTDKAADPARPAPAVRSEPLTTKRLRTPLAMMTAARPADTLCSCSQSAAEPSPPALVSLVRLPHP